MSRRTLFILFTVVALVLVPVNVFAQDGEPEMETYTSADGLLTFSYPAEWLVFDEEEDAPPFPFITLSPSEETFERLNADEDWISGDQAMAVVIMPAEFLSFVGEDVPEDATAGDFATLFANLFFGEFEEGPAEDMEGMEEPAEEEMAEATEEAAGEEMAEPTEEAMMGGLTVDEPEEIELSDTLTGGAVTFNAATEDGLVIVRELGEGLLGVTLAAAYTGEFTDEARQLAQDVAASVEYTGTADAIMEMMMAAPEVEVEPSDVDPATLDGNALIDERCTVCHTRERIDQQDKDEEGWTQTVDRMISYGADLDAAERQAVIDYLVETH